MKREQKSEVEMESERAKGRVIERGDGGAERRSREGDSKSLFLKV
jgi:hypothetical protein